MCVLLIIQLLNCHPLNLFESANDDTEFVQKIVELILSCIRNY